MLLLLAGQNERSRHQTGMIRPSPRSEFPSEIIFFPIDRQSNHIEQGGLLA